MRRTCRLIAIGIALAALGACAIPKFSGPASDTQGSNAPNGLRRAATALPSLGAHCRTAPDAERAQYIVGYGSLMQDESRKRTSPQAGPAHPVEIVGFRRGWFAKGSPIGFSATYLGVTPDPKGQLNAVIYRVEVSELAATDRREAIYCRQSVPLPDINMLEAAPPQTTGAQAWIYVNEPETMATPSARYPIVQSYVDIFLSGCFELERSFDLKGFARRCVQSTSDWSPQWVNDRLYPRRPFIYQPKARDIDTLLSEQLPELFSSIRIE